MRLETARQQESGLRQPRTFRRRSLAGLGLLAVALLARASVARAPARKTLAGPPGLRIEELTLLPGDLLFRRGRNLISRAVLAADTGSEYSHVGLVSMSGGQVWVLHSVPPEETKERGGAIAEPLRAFLATGKASAAAVYRPRDSQAVQAAETAAWGYVRAHKPFDSAFELGTDERLYCTELVWKSYRAAGVDLAVGPLSRGQYLLPSNLLRSPQLVKTQVIEETKTQ